MLMQFLQWAEALTHYQASSTICYLKRYLNSCIFILYVQKMTSWNTVQTLTFTTIPDLEVGQVIAHNTQSNAMLASVNMWKTENKHLGPAKSNSIESSAGIFFSFWASFCSMLHHIVTKHCIAGNSSALLMRFKTKLQVFWESLRILR